MNEATNALGAAMRKAVINNGAPMGGCTREVGTLFLHLTRYGNDWALELCDEIPIDAATQLIWSNAVGAPGEAKWHSEAHGKVCRFEWTGTEDAAPEGTRAFYLGGAR